MLGKIPAKHFNQLQMLPNERGKQVLWVWSITGHGKGEVDYVGGWLRSPLREQDQINTYIRSLFKHNLTISSSFLSSYMIDGANTFFLILNIP